MRRKRKQVLLTLILLGVLMAVTACGTRAGQPEATQVQPEPTATVNTETDQFDPKYDLKNPDFFSKFVAYFDLDKAALIQKLQQDYKEAPIEGTDSATGMPWVKLDKAGLTFYLTEGDEVPVSHVEIAETNPIHYGGARGQMTFSDVMKKAGETMVMEDPDLEKSYSITYPMKEVSVVFYTKNVYDPSSTMEVSSWGYYDQEPTLRSATEIQTNRGSFQLPRNWVGKISLREMVNTHTLSYLGKKEVYPLIEIVAMNVREWNEMDQAEYKIIFENEDGVVAAKTLETNKPSDQEEAEVFLTMESEVEKMLDTFKPDDERGDTNTTGSFSVCTDSLPKVAELKDIFKAFEQYYQNHSEDPSEAGMDKAYSEFGNCFTEKVNDMVSDNSIKGKEVSDLRASISDLNSSWYDWHYYSEGGGTMWSHMSIRQGSMIDAVLYGYLQQLDSNMGSKSIEAKFNELIQQLMDSRDYYKQGNFEAMNEEDQASLDEATKKLVSSYDDLLSFIKKMPLTEASILVLEFLSSYNPGE
ncbi:hypothetical protein [Paenibacillus sanfengchensis]|uniref:hypothetical protein n=1 Tax=Paenibacillus sanfengchensis TaxID=3119819 RepID=UPI002FDF1258